MYAYRKRKIRAFLKQNFHFSVEHGRCGARVKWDVTGGVETLDKIVPIWINGNQPIRTILKIFLHCNIEKRRNQVNGNNTFNRVTEMNSLSLAREMSAGKKASMTPANRCAMLKPGESAPNGRRRTSSASAYSCAKPALKLHKNV